jgi:hypothetical protein
MSKKTHEYKAAYWRKKAFTKNKEIKRARKRILELTLSRDRWKSECQNRNKSVESRLNQDKAFGHQYPLLLVLLTVLWQSYGGMSLRGVRHCFSHLIIIFELNCRLPIHVSIRNWICKSGYYRIKKE